MTVLFTSRHKGADGLGRIMKTPPITEQEGLRLLLYGSIDQEITETAPEASKIDKRLEGLTLAID